jgi:hypothetical protein
MGRLTRKNLVVDDARVKELAALLKTSESEAVRRAVDFALSAAEIEGSITALQNSGGIDDVFRKLDADDSIVATASQPASDGA